MRRPQFTGRSPHSSESSSELADTFLFMALRLVSRERVWINTATDCVAAKPNRDACVARRWQQGQAASSGRFAASVPWTPWVHVIVLPVPSPLLRTVRTLKVSVHTDGCFGAPCLRWGLSRCGRTETSGVFKYLARPDPCSWLLRFPHRSAVAHRVRVRMARCSTRSPSSRTCRAGMPGKRHAGGRFLLGSSLLLRASCPPPSALRPADKLRCSCARPRACGQAKEKYLGQRSGTKRSGFKQHLTTRAKSIAQ